MDFPSAFDYRQQPRRWQQAMRILSLQWKLNVYYGENYWRMKAAVAPWSSEK